MSKRNFHVDSFITKLLYDIFRNGSMDSSQRTSVPLIQPPISSPISRSVQLDSQLTVSSELHPRDQYRLPIHPPTPNDGTSLLRKHKRSNLSNWLCCKRAYVVSPLKIFSYRSLIFAHRKNQ
jgi:hypothetical protein